MENEPTSARSRFPGFRALCGALFNRRAAFVLIAIVTLIALFYAEENFRGKRAWDRYRKNAEARGVELDFAKTLPPPIPDAQNAAMTPLIQSWFPKPRPDDTNRWPELISKAYLKFRRPKGAGSNNADDRRLTDFVAWQQAFVDARLDTSKPKEMFETERDPGVQAKAAAAVLDELKIYEPALSELRKAAQRPGVRYPVEYKMDDPFSILLPHLAKIKSIVQELKLQASAELAVGQTDRAFENVRLMLWLCDSLRDEGFLICQLVRIACLQIATQPIWEGLVEHKWSEGQLKEIQARMLGMNFAESMSHSMDSERSGGVLFIQSIIKKNNLGEVLAALEPQFDLVTDMAAPLPTPPPKRMMGLLIPRGWLYFEMVNHASLMDVMVDRGWEPERMVFHPKALAGNETRFTNELRHGVGAIVHHHTFANLLLPALTKASQRFARAQSTVNQVALACALERRYKTDRAYPDALDTLVPSYIASIPNEAVSLTSMRYLRTADGYVLYSAGWDEKDDGGALFTTNNRDRRKGDWVWRIGK